MSILFICNTPYQLFNAINIVKNEFEEDSITDIIVTNHSLVSEYRENIKQSKLFRNVYYAESKDLSRKFYFFNDKKKHMALTKPQKFLNKILKIDYAQYDRVFFANIDGYINLIYRLIISQRQDVLFEYYEDGWVSYITNMSEFGYSPYERYCYETLHMKILQKNIDYIWIYKPSLFIANQEDKEKLRKIPRVDIDNQDFKDCINQIFDYRYYPEYARENIFLEEAFAEDGYANNDMEIIQRVCEFVGKDHFLLKRHPRLKAERWDELGIVTNTDLKIPWEVLILNNDFSEKKLFTISSNACMTPQLVFGISLPVFYFRKSLRGGISRTYQKKEFDIFTNEFANQYGNDKFYQIASLNDLEKYYHEYLYQQQKDALSKL